MLPAMIALRQFDLVLLALGLPVFLAGHLPLLGWAVASAVWLVQRGLQWWLMRKAVSSDDPRTVVGITAASMLGRGWLVAGGILAAGLSNNSAGLAAAVMVLILFSVYFTIGMVVRPFQQPGGVAR